MFNNKYYKKLDGVAMAPAFTKNVLCGFESRWL